MGHYFISKTEPLHRRIAVRTFVPPPPPPLLKENKITKRASTEKPQKKKEAAAPQPVAKKGEKPSTKKNESKELLLQEITKSLNNFHAETKQRQEPLSVPTLKSVEMESPNNEPEPQNLVAFLQNSLELPEFGSVIAQIEIGETGELLSCEIIEARSKKNGEFLKKRLHELRFPCFNDKKTFTITFRNVENL